jgi:pSer/pThr/pTyr-binding forkhead associated (FHA) protein
MPLNAKLVVVGGDVKTEEFKLRLPSTVGRGKGTTIMLVHPLVSRKHCELYEAEGQLMVRDLGSLNGTFVNNQRVSEAPLKPGELLTIGTVTFRAVYESDSELSPPTVSGPYEKVSSFAEAAARKASGGGPAVNPGAKTVEDVRETEFNFDKPLFSEEPKPAPAASGKTGTRRIETTATEEKIAKAAEKKPAPRPAAKPAASPPPDDPTIDFKPLGDDDDDKVAPASDEDLDDFLKSLEN